MTVQFWAQALGMEEADVANLNEPPLDESLPILHAE
jgi:hypothetical protein